MLESRPTWIRPVMRQQERGRHAGSAGEGVDGGQGVMLAAGGGGRGVSGVSGPLRGGAAVEVGGEEEEERRKMDKQPDVPDRIETVR